MRYLLSVLLTLSTSSCVTFLFGAFGETARGTRSFNGWEVSVDGIHIGRDVREFMIGDYNLDIHITYRNGSGLKRVFKYREVEYNFRNLHYRLYYPYFFPISWDRFYFQYDFSRRKDTYDVPEYYRKHGLRLEFVPDPSVSFWPGFIRDRRTGGLWPTDTPYEREYMYFEAVCSGVDSFFGRGNDFLERGHYSSQWLDPGEEESAVVQCVVPAGARPVRVWSDGVFEAEIKPR